MSVEIKELLGTGSGTIGSWTRDYYVTTTATVSQLPTVITATIVVWYATSGPGDLI
jgi:hypothetical protein